MLNSGLIVSCQACENEPLYGYGIMNLTEINGDEWNYNQDMYIPFVESHDSYFDKKIGFSSKWKSDVVVKKYKNECLKHKNSMFFARPLDNSWIYANK